MREVRLEGISKRYGGMLANDDISVTFRPGEIHVIVGENGAGKSTLMGILSGTVRPDAGAVLIDGEDVAGHDARAAIRCGIGMVHQHFRLVDVFTVAENIALGFEPRSRFGLYDADRARQDARVVSERFGLALDPDAVVGELPIGLQQRVEIVTVLMRGAQVLIFDEPTAVLTDEESESFFEVLRRLRADGRAIVFITHKLREALALADTVSVLRRGRVVATLDPAATTVAELGTLMVGRSVETVARSAVAAGPGASVAGSASEDALLSLRGVSLRRGGIDEVGLHDVSLEVRAGQILALLGVDGNGQQEIISVLTGTHAPDQGTVHVGGVDLTGASGTADFLAAGVGIIPADRHREGLVLSMSLARNLVLDRRHERRFRGRLGLLDDRKIEAYAGEMIARYDIRVPGPRVPVRQLSGGNQQKVILARELERDISVLVAAHPTRGLDVGSIQYVHGRLVELAERGRAVVLVTSDIDEAMALADRVAVLYRGRVAGVVARPVSRDELGVLMGGG
jgi:ABC-type uncharacterized transport system ATPase subunit